MSISTVDLKNFDPQDPQSVRPAVGGRTPAFFRPKLPIRIDRVLLEQLKEESRGGNIRICLHDRPESDFHEMIILERRGKYYRPHKHLNGESYHIMEGRLGVFIYDEAGTIVDQTELSPGKNLIYRVGKHMLHSILPLSDLVIYHESKLGPFATEGASLFPDWAPPEEQTEAVQKFQAGLYARFGS